MSARTIVSALIANLDDRRGLGHEWRAIDAEVQAEIVAKWERIVGEGMGPGERDALLDAITTAAQRAGICRADVERLDGPTALMLLGDMAGEIEQGRADLAEARGVALALRQEEALLDEIEGQREEAARIAGGADADPEAWEDEINSEARDLAAALAEEEPDAYRASLVTLAALCLGALRALARAADATNNKGG